MNTIAIAVPRTTVVAIVESAAEITEIDELTQYDAVTVIEQIAAAKRDIETSRKELTAPLVERKREIDNVATELDTPLSTQLLRLNRLLGNYAAAQEAKARAEQQRLIAEASPTELDRADAVAAATTVEEVDEINESHSRAVAAAQLAVIAAAPAPIVKVGEEWEYEITDMHLLYVAHPEAVKMEGRLSVIKSLLKARNGKVAGVTATKSMVAKTPRKAYEQAA